MPDAACSAPRRLPRRSDRRGGPGSRAPCSPRRQHFSDAPTQAGRRYPRAQNAPTGQASRHGRPGQASHRLDVVSIGGTSSISYEGERAAIRVPEAVDRMDEHADRRGIDRLGPPRPSLKGRVRRSAERMNAVDAESRASESRIVASAVERMSAPSRRVSRGEGVPARAPATPIRTIVLTSASAAARVVSTSKAPRGRGLRAGGGEDGFDRHAGRQTRHRHDRDEPRTETIDLGSIGFGTIGRARSATQDRTLEAAYVEIREGVFRASPLHRRALVSRHQHAARPRH